MNSRLLCLFSALTTFAATACDPLSTSPSTSPSTCAIQSDCESNEVCLVRSDATGRCVRADHFETLPDRSVKNATRRIAILFVVDNGPDSYGLQKRLLETVDLLEEVSASPYSGVDYRVGVLPIDGGHSNCLSPGGVDNENTHLGLVASSCAQRRAAFIGQNGEDYNDLCDESCGSQILKPDTTLNEWVFHSREYSNLKPGQSLTEALKCILPQGVQGCAYSPLIDTLASFQEYVESESFTIEFAQRSEIHIVVVSNRFDCSFGDKQTQVLGDGLDPNTVQTHCWNAGAVCKDGECSPFSDMHPGRKALFDTFEERFKFERLDITLIGGPTNAADQYTKTQGDSFATNNGVDATCDDGEVQAAPDPFFESLVDRKISVCEENYAEAYEHLAYPTGRIEAPDNEVEFATWMHCKKIRDVRFLIDFGDRVEVPVCEVAQGIPELARKQPRCYHLLENDWAKYVMFLREPGSEFGLFEYGCEKEAVD